MKELTIDDAWETDDSSGLLTSYYGTIAESYFYTDPKYNNGQSLLLGWTIDPESVELADPDAEFVFPADGELTERYGVGGGWETNDGGETAEHRVKNRITSSSQYGRIIDSIQGKIEGLGENATCASQFDIDDMDFADLIDELKRRGSPVNAEIWNGLRFRFEEIHIDYGKDKQGNQMQTRRNFPVAYVPDEATDGGKPKTKKTAKKTVKKVVKKKAKAKPAPEPETEVDEAEAGIPDDVFTEMLAIAAECETFEEYADAALSSTTIVSNEAALADLTDENESATWARACADAEEA